MQQLGTTDLQVYDVGLGGNVFGWTIGAEPAFEVLDSYTEAGGNFVDTADAYSQWVDGNHGGESESIIGEWLERRGNRSEVVLATKVGSLASAPGLGSATVREGLERSLRRLRTDYLDLYYAHRDDGVTPIPEIYQAFEDLVQAGKIRYVAASNFTGSRLQELADLADAERRPWLAAYQAHYNLVERSGYESEVRPVLEAAGIPCLPFYSLASGFLTGKYRPGSETNSGGARQPAAAAYLQNERNVGLLTVMDAVAAEEHASLTAVALAWLRAQPTVAVPTASVTNARQMTGLIAGAQLTLSPEVLRRLDEASSAG